jgi:hypothetical protein
MLKRPANRIPETNMILERIRDTLPAERFNALVLIMRSAPEFSDEVELISFGFY